MIPDLRVEVPIRAKVRTGIKDSRGYPKATGQFHSTDADFQQALEGATSLTVRFPFTTADECLRTSLELWQGSTLKCWCNDTHTAHRRDMQGNWATAECGYTECKQWTNGKGNGCGAVGRLRFIIPELHPNAVWQLDTKSWNTISKCMGALTYMQPINPVQLFELKVNEEKTQTGKFFYLTLHPLASPIPELPPEPQEEDDNEYQEECPDE